ncbi:hypothetical protein G7Y89_g7902 [Cudoniella acicularis]|uniref:Nucleoporin NDC1 n=1 Tax=Cudoniella acicularis TaxID=354080 RepID=A0A8H4RKB6_9HELO|nr:hypothetical protein G7Y89_g7902 [Cudoniella acicularis]
MAKAPRIRPYKDFLTPALHRRFAMATAVLFGLCYVESVLIGEWNSILWSWFPFGRAGLRAGLLFIPAFMIFILRVAQLHVGLRTSYSAWETFRNYSLRFDVINTIAWYFISAYIYSEIYVWSVSKDADLNRIKLIPKTDRPILNEKPIYLTSFLLFLAFVQSGFHLFYDYDRIDMPVVKTPSSVQNAHLVVPPATQLKTKLPSLVLSSLKRAITVALIAPFLYSMNWGIYPYSIRRLAWSFTRSWAKVFWSLPKSNSLPNKRPFHIDVLVRTMTSGFLLLMMWELGNAAFSAYVAQEPLKNERPITHESRDPNGSLLTGLKGKKLQTRAFAFWELVYIAERFEGRRKNIFEDIDRAGGSTWSQILAICLEIINGIDSRITEYQMPKLPANDAKAKSLGVRDPALPPHPEPLPRISKPIKDGLHEPGDIFTSTPKPKSETGRGIEAVGRFAKRHGQSPPGPVSPKSKQLLLKAEGAVLTPQQQQALSTQGVTGLFRERILWFLQTSLGWPFRQEYRRRMAAIVLGTPYGDVGIVVDAVDALTRFAVCSLTEDKYGNVQKDVKTMIQTFTKSIVQLEEFKIKLGVHWTDVEKRQESPEVDIILAALRGGLNELITAFGDYAGDLRLSQTDMRKARETAAPKQPRPNMEQVR